MIHICLEGSLTTTFFMYELLDIHAFLVYKTILRKACMTSYMLSFSDATLAAFQSS